MAGVTTSTSTSSSTHSSPVVDYNEKKYTVLQPLTNNNSGNVYENCTVLMNLESRDHCYGDEGKFVFNK